MFNEENVTAASQRERDVSSQFLQVDESMMQSCSTSSDAQDVNDVIDNFSHTEKRTVGWVQTGQVADKLSADKAVSDDVVNSIKRINFSGVASNVRIMKRVEKRLRTSSSVNVCSLDNCAKMVSQLSRELALLHGLSHGIGVDTDSGRLREELRLCGQRACYLAHQNGISLMPLFRRKKSLQTEEKAKVESVYRMYSGCLEYLVSLLRHVKALVSRFTLTPENTCCFIRAGLSDPVDIGNKACYRTIKDGAPSIQLDSTVGRSADRASSNGQEDISTLMGDIRGLQELLHVVSNACDMHPWEVEDTEEEELKPRRMSLRRGSRRERKTGDRAKKTPRGENGRKLLTETENTPNNSTVKPKTESSAQEVMVEPDTEASAQQVAAQTETVSPAQQMTTQPETETNAQEVTVQPETEGRAGQKVTIQRETEASAQQVTVQTDTEDSAQHVAVQADTKGSAQGITVQLETEGSGQEFTVQLETEGRGQKVTVQPDTEGSAQRMTVQPKIEGSAQKVTVQADIESSAQQVSVQPAATVESSKGEKACGCFVLCWLFGGRDSATALDPVGEKSSDRVNISTECLAD